MGFSCPICSETLERGPPDPEVAHDTKISCTPCGHIFHSYCINKWTQGTLATSKQCPCCRKSIPKLKCLPLFPVLQDDTFLDDSTNEPVRCNHLVEITELKRENQKLKHKIEQDDILKKTLEDDVCREKARRVEETKRKEVYEIKYLQMTSFQTLAMEVQKKLHAAEARLAALENINKILETVQNDVAYCDGSNYETNEGSIKSLVDANNVLTRELRIAVRRKKETDNEVRRLQEEKRDEKRMMLKLKEQNSKLTNELESLKISLKPSINDSMIETIPISPSAMVAGSRKRKPQLSMDDSVIEVPQIDDDVGLLKPFHGTQMPKSKSSNSFESLPGSSKSSIHNNPDSSKRLLQKVTKSSSDIPSASVSLSRKKRPQTTAQLRDAVTNDFSPLQFRSNLKSSLVGIPDSPLHFTHMPKSQNNTRPGIPKPPKVLRK